MAQVACLPMDKLCALQELIQSCWDWRWCTRHELESLIGHLHHATEVVWPGCTFLCRMINLLQCFHKRDHPICLNSEFCLDLQWCFSSCPLGTTSNFGCSMACPPPLTWKSHLMHQVPLALVPISTWSGSGVHGFLLKPLTIKPIKSCSRSSFVICQAPCSFSFPQRSTTTTHTNVSSLIVWVTHCLLVPGVKQRLLQSTRTSQAIPWLRSCKRRMLHHALQPKELLWTLFWHLLSSLSR